MILASAQIIPSKGQIESNLVDHYNLIELASKHQVDLILFPEMSITGYEREQARKLAFTKNDPRLGPMRKLSVKKKMTVVAGAPIILENEIYIGAFILQPDNSLSIYIKQYLHPGEEKFFKSSGDYYPVIYIQKETISFAICAEINNPKHAENACKNDTTIYLASIFFSSGGMKDAYETLSNYAKKYKMNVLMSNYCGEAWGINSGGRSGFWDKDGRLIANLDEDDPGLLIAEKTDTTWVCKPIKYETKK